LGLYEEEQKEEQAERHSHTVAPRQISATQLIIAALAIIAVSEFVLLMSRSRAPAPATSAPVAASVVIESTPAGALIAIDGHARGITPLTLTLSPGKYPMTITSDGVDREIPLVVRAGNNSELVYLGTGPSATSTQNAIGETKADKPGTPVAVAAAQPPANAVGGWLSVTAPVELQLFEHGAFIGSSQSDRIMLPVGRHVIEAINTNLGYKTTSTVQVSPGSVARFAPEMPNGTLNVNATPWADVTIDGKRLGTTPLGNLSLPIGPHDVVFTHPQLGERRQAILVTLNGINRISVNLNQR
jgi:serine/threonine-protein kinase